MPVEIEVSDEQLAKPGVGRALADLMLAMAGDVLPAAMEPPALVTELRLEASPKLVAAKEPVVGR